MLATVLLGARPSALHRRQLAALRGASDRVAAPGPCQAAAPLRAIGRRRQRRIARAEPSSAPAPAPAVALAEVHQAAEQGKLVQLKLALDSLQDPEKEVDQLVALPGQAADAPRQAPLHRAAAAGREACMKLLLLSGADRDLQDSRGRTPLMLAASAGQEECVEVLLSGGVVKVSADEQGRTAVHLAAAAGRETVLRQLLRENPKALVGKRDAAGATALHLAAARGDVPCLRALLSAGAKAGEADGQGRTARALAAAAGPAGTAAELYLLAVESTGKADPGRPTRAELLADVAGAGAGSGGSELASIYHRACLAQAAQGGGEAEAALQALRGEVRALVERQGQVDHFFGADQRID